MTRLVVLVTILLAVAGLIYWRGVADERAKDAENYGHTRGVIDDAVSDDLPDDVVLERLRRHAER